MQEDVRFAAKPLHYDCLLNAFALCYLVLASPSNNVSHFYILSLQLQRYLHQNWTVNMRNELGANILQVSTRRAYAVSKAIHESHWARTRKQR